MFGFGETYTREKFDEAKKEEDVIKKTHEREGSSTDSDSMEVWSELFYRDAREAHARVQKLYGKGEKEARALNEEYDRLQERAKEAVKAVTDFEKEKLEMHQEK